MIVLAMDTATPATVAGVARDGTLLARRDHQPAPGERPGHAAQLLGLCAQALDEAGLGFADVDRVAVGTGPGTFTGLRIGVATARALALAHGAQLAGVSTLAALAAGARHDGPVLAVLDARRGEAFAAAWHGDRVLAAPVALAPERLAELLATAPGSWLGVGDGALGFRDVLEAAGAQVPGPDDERHRVSAAALCELGARAQPAGPEGVTPDYVRAPDAEQTRRSRAGDLPRQP